MLPAYIQHIVVHALPLSPPVTKPQQLVLQVPQSLHMYVKPTGAKTSCCRIKQLQVLQHKQMLISSLISSHPVWQGQLLLLMMMMQLHLLACLMRE